MTMRVDSAEVTALDARHVLQTYKRQPVVFVRGEGTHLIDADGRRYLDFVSGIGVVALGHGHPGLAEAIADQARTLIQTSNLYHHPWQGRAAARLASLSGLERAFFCNSGTEAVEACLKLARGASGTRRDRRRARGSSLSSTASRAARSARCR
ncbi:MAG: aminotransferase class III-fold pyridoxal phosphate-dependent enzyme [Vicinamibacteria bacterium]